MQVNTGLKIRLLELGITQVELARELDITPGRLSGYINGYVRTPSEIDRRIQVALASQEPSVAREPAEHTSKNTKLLLRKQARAGSDKLFNKAIRVIAEPGREMARHQTPRVVEVELEKMFTDHSQNLKS